MYNVYTYDLFGETKETHQDLYSLKWEDIIGKISLCKRLGRKKVNPGEFLSVTRPEKGQTLSPCGRVEERGKGGGETLN